MIDRSRTLAFRWNGGAYPAYPGDTIVSALAAAGERVFSRSFKYHRPRGLLTADFLDPGCLLPGRRRAQRARRRHRRVEAGMDVRSQNTWPSLRYDLKAVNGLAGRFLATGFYYKTFIKPERLWPAYETGAAPVRARRGGVAAHRARLLRQALHPPDVLVAGGGPAGMAAALAAARAGAAVLLVEEEHHLGGHLRWGDDAERAVGAELAERVLAEPGIEVLINSVVVGRWDDNWVGVVQRGLPQQWRSAWSRCGRRCLVVAPGLIERPYVFAGNDLPGVMLSTARSPADQPLRGAAGAARGRLLGQPGGRRRRRRPAAGRCRVAAVVDARGRRAGGPRAGPRWTCGRSS